MNEDAELLRRYEAERSETAFAELVRRHVDLVYSAALRLVNGDVHRAEDVAQQVFIELSRQARSLVKHPALAGWLYTTTRNLALRAIRSDQRRQAREQEATTMSELLRETGTETDWTLMRPLLDDAMHELGETDRAAVVLRFFQNRSLADVGTALDLNENAARMRVSRALEKLQAILKRRGIKTGVAALSGLISANAVQAAPVGLAATITSATALTATTTSTAITATKAIAMTTLQKTVVGAIIVAAIATPLVMFQQQQSLRAENQSLRQQVAALRSDNADLTGNAALRKKLATLSLPAPQVQAATTSSDDMPGTNLYARLKDQHIRLTAQQIEPYLKANNRSAASLLAAYRTTGDPALLAEAMQRFPNDPQVAFEAAFKKDATPEERLQWLDAMKKSDPNNSLPNYLAALDYFKSGQTDQAVRELMAASGKTQFKDYTQYRMQDDEEAFLAAGYSPVEAKVIPSWELLLPQLKQMKDLGLTLADLAKSYQQSGDNASAQATLQMVANLGQRYNDGPGTPEISWLVGMAVEKIALQQMDPNSPYGSPGQTAQDRLNQINQAKSDMKDLNDQLEPLFPTMSDLDWMSYKDRWRIFGERSAVQWVVNKYGQK